MEMTQEEKARAYDEALERAKKFEEKYGGGYAALIFPELKESEDERVRKILIRAVNTAASADGGLLHHEAKQCLAWLEKQKEQIPYTDFVIKPHKGDDTNPYDMSASEAEEYTIKRGFGIPFIDGEVYVDERHMTQTVGNVLRWADEHPKEQKPVEIHIDNPNVQKFDPDVKITTSDSSADGKELLYVSNKSYKIGYRDGVASVKPTEWSEEEQTIIEGACNALEVHGHSKLANRLKSLRPSWKPSKDEERLINTSISFLKDFADKGYENAVECIDWLKSKSNGSTCE